MLRGHFFVFPTVLRILLNCPFFEKHENRFYPTIDYFFHLLSPPHGTVFPKTWAFRLEED